MNENWAQHHNDSPIFLIRGESDGKAIWHYLQVDKLKLPLYKRAAMQGSIDVADYGTVLISGWGDRPSDAVVKKIEAMAND